MKLKELSEWLSHPVTSEIIGALVALSIILMIEKHEARLHLLEIQNDWRLEAEAAELKGKLR